MSWTISITKAIRQNAAEIIDAAQAVGNEDCPQEREEQVIIAKSVALQIVESDALFSGDPGDMFNISLYGHANPEHKNHEGYSNDTITINIYRAAP